MPLTTAAVPKKFFVEKKLLRRFDKPIRFDLFFSGQNASFRNKRHDQEVLKLT